MKKHNSKLEDYWTTGNYEKFNIEIKKFTGFITRKFFKGFKQSSEEYNEIQDRCLVRIYKQLTEGHYNPLKSEKQNKFNNYIFTQIRGELTKFFNKYNRTRTHLDVLNCFADADTNNSYNYNINYNYDMKDEYDYVKNEIYEIIKEYTLSINLDDVFYILYHESNRKSKKLVDINELD